MSWRVLKKPRNVHLPVAGRASERDFATEAEAQLERDRIAAELPDWHVWIRESASKLDMLHQIEYGYDSNHSPLLDAFARDTRYRPRPLTPRERLRRRRRVVWERIGDTWRVLRHGLPEHDEW